MMLKVRLVSAVFVVALSTTATTATPQQKSDRDVVTRSQILDGHFQTAYEAVESLRSTWLRERGPLSFSTPVVPLVYLDFVRLGTVETLKTLPAAHIASVTHLDGVAATARYGVGHGAGVIQVATWPMGAPPRGDTIYAGDNIVIEGNPRVVAADGFPLSVAGRSAPILLSASEYPGVARAVRDFAADVGRVTGVPAAVTIDTLTAKTMVIAGTIGKSAVIDRLIQNGKLNATGVTGKWEMYVRQVVQNPMPGVDQALVVAGSDKRGTIYGVYDISSLIGVSPWYWWADVPTPRADAIYVPTARYTQGEPAVKYRGIFINDEAPAFSGWTREKFGGVNHVMYEKMFELILRMKGNYLWPAMWGNAFTDDDSLNAIKADEYGIVMGTSHHEPMTRAQKEWTRYGKGPWDYGVNDTTLRAFWRAGIERMGTRENIVTLGMRGDGDRPMTTNGQSNVALLEQIVADQRKILGEATKKDPSQTPSLWALYKEVQDYYDKGMRVPDDVTLLFSDDNWGNIRRLPSAADRSRKGGFGIYYHFDYVGGPRNYKWLNTNPIARVWEQMHLANEYGANRIWVVNVGDLKPMEFPIQFFLDYAWNPSKLPAERLPDYTRQWAAQQFGHAHAVEIADIITRYLKYAARRKPEMLSPDTYSLPNYREAETVLAEYAALQGDVVRVGKNIPASHKDAYYQLVQHPVEAAANLNDLYITVAKNRAYAAQGRAMTNDLADRARALFENDAEISRYYNTQLAGGKWSHMMDQTHIGYTIWQEPPRNVMPRVDVIQLPNVSDMGVAYEGQQPPPVFGPGGGGGRGGFRPREAALPEFDKFNQQRYYIDVYSKGEIPFTYEITTAQPWVMVDKPSGPVDREQRVWISVDWSRAPIGISKVPVSVAGPNNQRVVVQANIRNPATPVRESIEGFVQGNGLVSMEAEHFTRAVTTPAVRWLVIPDLGRTLSGVTPTPVDSKQQTLSAGSPHLEYKMFLFDSGTVTLNAYFSPTLNFTGTKEGLRYAVSFDDEPPQVIPMVADSTNRMWEQSVGDQIVVRATTHAVARAGEHVMKFWMVDPGLTVQKFVVDAGGMLPSYLGPPESFRGTAKGASKR